MELALDSLLPLITSKTRLVAFSACSNILGGLFDIPEIIKAAREKAREQGARKIEFCIDCVAFAPHRRIDVQKWDVDYCFFSYYKVNAVILNCTVRNFANYLTVVQVYGPHTSVLYARSSSLKTSLSSLAHHFLKVDDKSYKLQPGGAGYELTYGTTAVLTYLRSLSPSGDVDDAFERIATQEQELVKPLLAYLTSPESRARGVHVVGREGCNPSRVPTISFVVTGDKKIASKNIVSFFDKKGGVSAFTSNSKPLLICSFSLDRLEFDGATFTLSHWLTLYSQNSMLTMALYGSHSYTTIPWRRSTRSFRA